MEYWKPTVHFSQFFESYKSSAAEPDQKGDSPRRTRRPRRIRIFLFINFVLLYFRICARRVNFSHLETLGFGYSSRQDAKNAKFGNLFLLCAFASLREMFRFFLVAASPR
jgi:hypothetical protein